MNFKSLLFPCLTVLAALLFSSTATAQCQYRLEMYDAFGDGWTGGKLTIKSGTLTHEFYLDNIVDDGSDSTVLFAVQHNKPLIINWQEAIFFNTDVSFEIFDFEDNLVFDAAAPAAGQLFSGTAKCPACLAPANFKVENLWDNRVRLRWSPLITDSIPKGWWVIWGEPGFSPAPGFGDSIFTNQPKATVTGLLENTAYDIYLAQDCGGGVTPELVGPISIKTYWSDDVGIAGVTTPTSGCKLSNAEVLTVLLKNSGANPQSLVPFYYAVNGKPAGIPFPDDGLYTAVLGKDSSESIEFETKFDFSAPGEYVIQVWTAMANDDFPENDTFTYRITNRLLVPYQQDFEDWTGDWRVDTASENSTWQWGKPVGQIISKAASGENAWVTNLAGNHSSEEVGYLTSPCFDFSAESVDPAIQFSLFYNTEKKYDGIWLESSLDGGSTWKKIGKQNEGLRWYNDRDTSASIGDFWTGDNLGWKTSRHILNGLAAKSEVRLRFVFQSDLFENFEGAGVDDIRILRRLSRDLAAESVVSTAAADDCGSATDTVVFRTVNIGTTNYNSFSVLYRINNGAITTESITNAGLQPDEIFTYRFNKTFDSRDGLFTIKCWTNLPNDGNRTNDTATIVIDHRALPVPLLENFESGNLPTGWFSDGETEVTDAHNNQSFVLAANLYDLDPAFSHTTVRHGNISAGDSLWFDYRITNYEPGTVATILEQNTRFLVEVSTDCGDTFTPIYTIDKSNHIPKVGLTRVQLDLSQFAGKAIVIRFSGVWEAGDFWFDLDNINIRTCPADMQLSTTVVNTAPGQSVGKATVEVGLGNPPYKYLWSNGAQTKTASGLAAGTVTVTVTDAKGCTDEISVQIGSVAVVDIEGLATARLQPNPSAGLSDLVLEFERPVVARVEVLNVFGQVLSAQIVENQAAAVLPLDIRSEADGLYLLRVSVGDGVRTLRWMKQSR